MKNCKSNHSAILLRGVISELKRSRRSHDFILTEVQHQQIGVTAIAASAMGIGATGMGLVSMAGNTDEEADWVEFELEGKQIQGWLWIMPMGNGDNVEVVAEQTGNNRYIAYAVKRNDDDLLAVYPHATAGRKVHYRNSLKIWAYFSIFLYLCAILILVIQRGFGTLLETNMQIYLSAALPFFLLITGLITFRVSRKFMGFVKIAELIFKTFGWPDEEGIDLRKTSIENRRENKLAHFGNFYFRYK